MNAIDIARTFAAHGQVEDAQKAYTLSLQQADGTDPTAELEAASYLFDSGGDYRVPYTTFQSLYNRGLFQSELFDLMVGAFYAPNMNLQERLYQRNCKLLGRYPYLFRKDFLPFDALPVKFFPFDEKSFLPFYTLENRFGEHVDFNHPVVSQNFFHDLDKPILAEDVFSQYELEYLNDNVRKSEWVARENHIYLHYADWSIFCAHLQCLDLRALLKDEKLVFLIGDERALYPIDFKERFGVDYGQYPVKPIGIREVKRLIWHTQLATHNGGDFFNEIFFGHPNLLANTSVMFDSMLERVQEIKEKALQVSRSNKTMTVEGNMDPNILTRLCKYKNLTDKDVFVALFLSDTLINKYLDWNARIVPALFFQPHFPNVVYSIHTNRHGRAVLNSPQYQAIQDCTFFHEFKYIKTFTPIRRLSTSYAASVKFMHSRLGKAEDGKWSVVNNALSDRILNRSFMIDWQDRFYQDSRLVRFEDGKLNPKATFTALAAFLDLPYTQSLTYCSDISGINPESYTGNAIGFDPATVYRTYDEYANDFERYYLEYFMRDVYEYYGYDFHYYDGQPVDEAKLRELVSNFTTLNRYIRESFRPMLEETAVDAQNGQTADAETISGLCDKQIEQFDENRIHVSKILMRSLFFVNKNGQPLHMMPLLKLDPALLEQPLYH